MVRKSEPSEARSPHAATVRGSIEAGAGDGGLPRPWSLGLIAVGAALFLVVCALSMRPVSMPPDHFTDMNVLMSGESFATQGFIKLRFLPLHFIGDVSDRAGYYTLYTHYPPLPNVLNGVLRRLGVHSLPVMRAICGFLMVAGLVAAARGFASLIGCAPALWGLVFVGMTGLFAGYCTSLHHTLDLFFLGVFFWSFLRGVDGGPKTGRAWLICWSALFLGSLTSFEFILHAQVFAWVYVLATGRMRAGWRTLILVGTAPVAGVGLHLLQVIWALGWTEAMRDGLGFFHIRAGMSGLAERWESLKMVPGFVMEQTQRLLGCPAHVLMLLGVFGWLLAARCREEGRPDRRTGALLLALAVASLAWYVAMPYHTVRHPHVAKQLVPLAMVAAGGVIALLARTVFGRNEPRLHRGLAALVGLVLVVCQAQSFTSQWTGEPDMAATLAEAIGPDALPPRVGILSNAGWPAQYGYFLRRPWWFVPNEEAIPPVYFPECIKTFKSQLAQGWDLRYYLFASWGTPEAYQVLASSCPGRRLSLGGQNFMVLFDIGNLQVEAQSRPALDPAVRERQQRGEFPPWEIPGFQERLRRGMQRQPRSPGG